MVPSNKIYISISSTRKAGRGVFVRSRIRNGEIIERCPVIEILPRDARLLKKSILLNYYFLWERNLKSVAVALGYGSLYNHSYEPNATYRKNFSKKVIDFVALRNIRKGEEITVNYNFGNPNDTSRLWIKSIRQIR